ncbi:MAG TPA: hypothetical protein PK413_12820 [Thermoanaerobaculia bacterium]|nr:hypothetical protein [Thermoanaerobaculia bacterium]
MSSEKRLEPLDWNVPTTPEDIEALRRARIHGPFDLRYLNLLSATLQFPHLKQSRATSEGWEPFRLEPEDG